MPVGRSRSTFSQTIRPWIELSRLPKFAGTMVLFWPFAWSLTMLARSEHMPLYTFVAYLVTGFIGASLLHSAGCIWNDILDRDFDRQVERTKHRPIADGRISVQGALVFLAIHLSILTMMVWDLNPLAWKLGIISIFVLPGIYPLMKRVTYWPQAWLGLAMNCGVPMAAASVTGEITKQALILSVGCWAWTMWYDTIYACQDMRDDVKAGVKSTALLFAQYTKPILSIFGVMLLGSLALCGVLIEAGIPYWTVSVACAAWLLTRELIQVDIMNPASCWQTFHRNGFTFGGVVFAGLMADYVASERGSLLSAY
ncbi:4-hydroxybenzoate polyprenyl transferase [Punctularia strigosozonata HHB-11173 SS5]|uniref:4-hydroxybenzoate polyprenyl transferase n=1 Tax=Punctularia strigosozonata (strain HHB-11173) TaxID=741275 RepID=UPI00044162C9|nr:4-hydroxybenzoate polyprenyl transferase [Punctularia strigosozonata HHB-11173 SS5]EIN11183.1 4-hydroxybenzoate polyprenyl transferase [Punctularia strigosozonata HHB-11173 SS5]